MTTLTKKHWRIALIIVAVVLAFIISTAATQQSETQEVVQPAPRQQRTGTAAAVEPSVATALKQIARTKPSSATGELFPSKSWYVPPPPPPPPPPAPPIAPPLPFTFLGKIENPDGAPTIILSGNNRVYLVKGGETIDGTYHVDGIANGQLTLTYLPMQIQQYLSMGDAP